MIKRFLSLAFLTLLLYSCTEKEELQKERVSFTITPKADGNESGRTEAADLPPGTALLVSITDGSGNPVLTRHKINLLSIGGSYITDPLELVPGRYILTDFLLVDDASAVLYATPLRNSKLSKIVNQSLPFSFVIGRNKVSNIAMEVVDAKVNQPQDFGYAAFEVSEIHPLQVSVFVKQGNGLALTTAKLYVTNYDDYPGQAPRTYNLTASVNLIGLKGDDESTYYLSIAKEGYKTWYGSFTYQEIIAQLNGNPLKVILEEPALTYTNPWALTTVSFNADGLLHVDYGNGETEERLLTYRPEQEGKTDGNWILLMSSFDPTPSNPVKVTGSLNVITSFYQSEPEQVDLSALTALQAVTLDNGWMDELNLSSNTALTTLNFYDMSFNNLILPSQSQINDLLITGESNVRAQAIGNVFNNAVNKNITGGYLNVAGTLVPLTAQEQNQVDVLKNDYGWTIYQPE